MMRTINGLFLILSLFSLNAIAAPQPGDPAEFLQKIYSAYTNDFESASFGSIDGKQVLSDEFRSVVDEDTELAGGEVGFLDADPICACQDSLNLTVEKINVISNDNQTSQVEVRFRPFADNPASVTQTFVLKVKNGAWLIDDIVTAEGSLHQNMQKSNENIKRNPPTPEDPSVFLQRFYTTRYHNQQDRNVPLYETGSMQVLSDSLLELLAENRKLTPSDEVGYLNGDPFCDCQDYDGLTVTGIKVLSNDNKEATVLVNIRPFKDFPDETTITLKLVARSDGWVADDFIDRHGSLRAAIEQDNQMRRTELSQQANKK